MKSLIKMTLLSSLIVLTLAGCDENNKTEKSDEAQNISTKVATISNATEGQKEAYALGSSFASYVKNDLNHGQINVDSDYFINGFTETFKGSSQQSEDEVKSILDNFSKRLQKEAEERINKQITENTAAGEKFRNEFATQKDVKQTKSGLMYQIIEPGTEPHPTEDDVVVVNYTGTLIDGSKFDSSFDRKEPTTFPLNRVIPGWTEGLQLIGKGGKIKLVVPPQLAYGDQNIEGNGKNAGITPASTLVFEIELLSIEDQNKASPEKNN